MSFEVTRTKERVCIYGEWFEINQPTVKDAIGLSKMAKESTEDQGISAMVSYVSSLGIPKEKLETMESSHFISLVEFLAKGTQKKIQSMSGQ